MTLQDTPNTPLAIHQDFTATRPTTLTVKQKYWSWFKNTGRGFLITKEDDSVMFDVSSKTMGKHRTIEDQHGRPLFDLERNWTSKKRAWILTGEEGVLMTVDYTWLRPRISMDVSIGQKKPGETGSQIHVKGSEIWGQNLQIMAGDAVLASMRCTNMTPGFLSSFKMSPPRWTADVVEAADLALVAVLILCVSDAFSEGRALML